MRTLWLNFVLPRIEEVYSKGSLKVKQMYNHADLWDLWSIVYSYAANHIKLRSEPMFPRKIRIDQWSDLNRTGSIFVACDCSPKLTPVLQLLLLLGDCHLLLISHCGLATVIVCRNKACTCEFILISLLKYKLSIVMLMYLISNSIYKFHAPLPLFTIQYQLGISLNHPEGHGHFPCNVVSSFVK